MKAYSVFEKPLTVFGIAGFDKSKKLSRLPDELLCSLPSLDFLGRRVPGARIGFRTNSKRLTVKIEYETLSIDVGMSIYACQSAFVYAGKTRQSSKFIGLVGPQNYEAKAFESTLDLSGEMQEVLILLPRNEIITDVQILVDDDATVTEPTPYKHPKPILYYGSSITEGGCSTNPANYYNAIISRHLDVDYYNFGFSGNCKGEPEMADFFNTLDFSIFVLDYDHNAPSVLHLQETHEPFYKKIREANKDVPIIMMTRPRPWLTDDEEARHNIVYQTYKNALEGGDKNVYFISGTSFFEDDIDAELCFIDGTHPNDLGFHKMAKAVEPLIKSLLRG